MLSNEVKILNQFKKIIASGTKKKSELFKRIYKIKSIPKNISSISERTILALNNKETAVSIDDANSMYINWNMALKLLQENKYSEITEAFEKFYAHEHAEIVYSDWDSWYNMKPDTADAQRELNEIEMFYIQTPIEIEKEYNEAKKKLDDDFNLRQGIIQSVFKGNGGRFRSFMKNRHKEQFLTLAELRKLDLIATDYCDGADWHHIVDSLEQMHTKESYAKALKELNQVKRSKLEEYNETMKRKLYLKKIVGNHGQ